MPDWGSARRLACSSAVALLMLGPMVGPSIAANVDGDARRGAALVANRQASLCLLCHAAPGVPASQVGTVAPDLSGAGARWSAEQLRERLVAPERINPLTLMPSYRRKDGFERPAAARVGQPIFTEQQLEDVVAYLVSLK